MFYIWLAVIILLVIIEIISINLTSISFIISGVLTLFISLIYDNFIVQISLFVLLGILFQIILKQYLIDFIEDMKEKRKNKEVFVPVATVTKEITKTKLGEVEMDGKFYPAGADKKFKVGSIVLIVEVNRERVKVVEYEEK